MTLSGSEFLSFDLEGELLLLLLLYYLLCFKGDKAECSETVAQDEDDGELSGVKLCPHRDIPAAACRRSRGL